MQEPGLDLHEWESRWQQLEPLIEDSPGEALPEVSRLVEQMLVEAGFNVDPRSADANGDEVVAEFRAAKEIADRVDAGHTVDPGDIGAAVEGFKSVRDTLFALKAGL
jgi:hypothetical protein